MKSLILLITIFYVYPAFSGNAIVPSDKPVDFGDSHQKCRAKNNAPVEITSSRTGSNVIVTIKAIHNIQEAKINFMAVDDLEFVTPPENIEKDLDEGEEMIVELKVRPTKHLAYVAVQVEGKVHQFPRVKTITVPIPGTSSFGNLPKELYVRKIAQQNQKPSQSKRKLTRKGKPVQLINE
ncbi:MAG: hypothetical protein EP319_11015 [Deltaproteobacteria bacterium]|nr:MAG: hypothetical protein EP319_11015 [Deltaproteobacteria bacterium]